jgi:putative NADH-flavin reductase
MNILVFGASGAIGQAIAAELLDRGHSVTGITRSGQPVDGLDIQVIAGDAADPAQVGRLAQGVDAVVSAVGPTRGGDGSQAGGTQAGSGQSDDAERTPEADSLLAAASGLIEGMQAAGAERLVIVGGAGSLEAAPGVRLVDTPDFHQAWKPAALAHARVLDEVFRPTTDLDWTYVSPAAVILPGQRTGHYRKGGDQLLTDEAGDSRISIPDFAIAVADVVESGGDIRTRITAAY